MSWLVYMYACVCLVVGGCGGMGLCGVLHAGKVLITSAQELLNYSQSEEEMMEAYIKKIVACGAGAVIVSGTIGQLALHFLEKYKILVMKIMSKFEMRRLAKVCGARLIAQVGAITPEDMGALLGHDFDCVYRVMHWLDGQWPAENNWFCRPFSS